MPPTGVLKNTPIRYRGMKNKITIQVQDVYKAFALMYLKEISHLSDLQLTHLSVIFKHWSENVEMTDSWRNAVCEDLGFETENKWTMLNKVIKELTLVHVRLQATTREGKLDISHPVIKPTKYLKVEKKRVLGLHPILELCLKAINKNPNQEMELTINYVRGGT